MMRKFILVTTGVIGIANSTCAEKQSSDKQHIILILCDDLGYSDLGCYGGEVATPNIDRLANQGVRFSQVKNTGRSCPSRAALMTGRYQHEVGLGWMTVVDEHREGYRGQIDANYPTLAEVMSAQGYKTYMSGKWHLTVDGSFSSPNGSFPTQRGFDRYYGSLHGGGSYYRPDYVYNDLNRVKKFSKDYYYTTAITDSAVSFIRQHPSQEPMFLYVAHYAPHLPLEAPEDRIQKCIERYKCGYDVLKKRRFKRLKEMGIIPSEAKMALFDREFGGKRPQWEQLSENQRRQWVRDMATYAAMIEIMDDGIGELVEAVRAKGMLENTVFMFLSDNGSTSEGGYIKQLMADLSNTPYRSYKKWSYYGGTSTPFILTYGDTIKNEKAGEICHAPAHIIDVLPTCLDLCEHPKKVKQLDLPGESLLSAMHQRKQSKRTLYFEHESSCAVIHGDWKLVRADKNHQWELINLLDDPFETTNLIDRHPKQAKLLEKMWDSWAKKHKVYPLENLGWGDRVKHYLEMNPDQDGIDE